MPQPKSKTSRVNRMSSRNAAPKPGPATVNASDEAEQIANEACGFKRYEVVAPLTLSAAKSPSPIGPTSVEYAPPSAISDREDVYDPRLNIYGRRFFTDAQVQTMAYLAQRVHQGEAGIGVISQLWHDNRVAGKPDPGPLEIAWWMWQSGVLDGHRMETEVEFRYGAGSRSVPDPTAKRRKPKPEAEDERPTVPTVRVWRSDKPLRDVDQARREMGDFVDDNEPLVFEGEEITDSYLGEWSL